MLKTSTFEDNFRAIVGPDKLRAALSSDAICGVLPQFVAEPGDEHQLASVLSLANESGVAVVPRGGGTKLNWGNPPKKAQLILSTARLNRIVEHAWADLTVTVEAGCTLQSLQQMLAQHGQRLAFDGLWPERGTIGGVLSTNDSGALRLRFGSLRDLIIGVTIALPDGTLASSGGKVVKNVAGYDLPKLVTGAFGTLGVITRAVFRLHPLPRTAKSISFRAENSAAIQQQILAIQDSQLAHTSLQIRAATGESPAADILFEATEAGLAAQESQLRKILGLAGIEQSPQNIWDKWQEIWNSPTNTSLLAKICILPTDIAKTLESLKVVGDSRGLNWKVVVQATGVGTLRLESEATQLSVVVEQLRKELESRGGSLTVLHRPLELDSIDAWGNAGDSVALMRAIKHQLDPRNTLNPGRFVGGI
jgi:glycolate dehydrogenase FAD-binding subunit